MRKKNKIAHTICNNFQVVAPHLAFFFPFCLRSTETTFNIWNIYTDQPLNEFVTHCLVAWSERVIQRETRSNEKTPAPRNESVALLSLLHNSPVPKKQSQIDCSSWTHEKRKYVIFKWASLRLPIEAHPRRHIKTADYLLSWLKLHKIFKLTSISFLSNDV